MCCCVCLYLVQQIIYNTNIKIIEFHIVWDLKYSAIFFPQQYVPGLFSFLRQGTVLMMMMKL